MISGSSIRINDTNINRNPITEKTGVNGGKKFSATPGTTREKIYSNAGLSTPRIERPMNPHHTTFLFDLMANIKYIMNAIKTKETKSCPPGSEILGMVTKLNKIIKPMYAEKSILTITRFFIDLVYPKYFRNYIRFVR